MTYFCKVLYSLKAFLALFFLTKMTLSFAIFIVLDSQHKSNDCNVNFTLSYIFLLRTSCDKISLKKNSIILHIFLTLKIILKKYIHISYKIKNFF